MQNRHGPSGDSHWATGRNAKRGCTSTLCFSTLDSMMQSRVKTHYLFPQAALQPKSLAGQEKGEERIGNTVEPFDEPGGNFRATRRDASLSVPGVVARRS